MKIKALARLVSASALQNAYCRLLSDSDTGKAVNFAGVFGGKKRGQRVHMKRRIFKGHSFLINKVLPTLIAGALLPLAANAAVLTFDDLAISGYIANGYGGLSWDNLYSLNSSTIIASGYQNGTVSGPSVAFNGSGAPAVIGGAMFDFNGVYLTGAWNNGLNIIVTGSLNGAVLYSQTVTVDSHQPTWFEFDFLGIDSLSFNTFGGIDAGYGGFGTHFAMDNFTYNEVSTPAVPIVGWTDDTLDLTIGNGGFFGPAVVLNNNESLAEHNLTIESNGRFAQKGGVHIISGSMTNNGKYTLSAGSLSAANQSIGDSSGNRNNFGYSATGEFTQSGGTNTVNGTLTLGKQAGDKGTYNLLDGFLVAAAEVIGDGGAGTFNQSGGVNNVSDSLVLGKQAGSSGLYNLYAGALTAAKEIIGDAGYGTFTQGDGRFGYSASNTVSDTLTVGKQAGSYGAYNLIAGALNAPQEIIGDAGSGVFNQYGGSNNVGDTLTVGKQAGSNGIYNLNAGTLTAHQEVVGDAGAATFNQSGGINTADTLTLAKQADSQGYYYLTDGTVNVTNAVIGDAGYGGFTQGYAFFPGPNSHDSTHNVAETLTLGKQSSGYGYYYITEGKLNAKNIVVGDAGQAWFGQGDYYSNALSKATVAVSEKLIVGRQAGSVAEYHFYAGSLTAANEIIADAGTGTFTQGEGNFGYGATNTVTDTLTVGKQAGSNGTYNLIAGKLNAFREVIGDAGTAIFNQMGGTNNVGETLTLGKQANGQGSYNLTGGSLTAVNEVIGDAGTGTFTQGEGNFGYSATNSISNTLTVGKQAGSNGVYNLIAGALTALHEIVGDAGIGTFNQSGGTNTVGNTLTVGKQTGGNGLYKLSAGALTATNEIIGDAGNGTFTQGEGNFGYSATNSVSNTLTVGKQAGSNGVYNLIAGALTALHEVVGDAGTGVFNQSGGTNTVNATLTLGKQVGGQGSYNLSGGALAAADEIIGDAGNGFFNQTGGTHTVDDTLTLGKQGSGNGTYQLVAGQLNTLNTVVGDAGNGLFTQYAGKHTVTGALILGKQVGGIGTYNMLGGALSAANQVVGDAGTGIVNQSGGTNVVEQLTFGKQSSGAGTYNLTGGSLTVGNIANGLGSGSLLISGGALNFGAGNHVVDVDTLTVSGQGVIKLADNAITTFQNNVTHNGQAINLGAGSNAIFNAAFNGAGPFNGTGTATFNGVFNPGNSPALFSVAGDMVLGESSKSIMEVTGLTRGTQYDAVNVGNGLTLNGELQIQFLSGFSPQLGTTFDLFDAETLAGHFDLVTLIGLEQGLGWKLDYLTDAIGTIDVVRLSVVSSVPLPGTIWLMQLALFSLAAVRRARKVLV